MFRDDLLRDCAKPRGHSHMKKDILCALPAKIETADLIVSQPCMEIAQALSSYNPKDTPLSPALTRDIKRNAAQYNVFGLSAQQTPHFEPAFVSIEETKKYIQKYPPEYLNMREFYYAYKNKPSGILGDVSLILLEEEFSIAWNSAYRAPRHKGLATQAARAVLLALRKLSDTPIQATIGDHNKPSQRLAQRLGMSKAEDRRSPTTATHLWRLNKSQLPTIS